MMKIASPIRYAAPLGLKKAEKSLDEAGITVNKNAIPFDPRKPMVTSGVRVGTPAVTSRGFGGAEMEQIAEWMAVVLRDIDNAELHAQIAAEVRELCTAFPVPGHARYLDEAADATHPTAPSAAEPAAVPSPT